MKIASIEGIFKRAELPHGMAAIFLPSPIDKPARYARMTELGGSSVCVIERMSDSRLLFDNLNVVRVPDLI
jgi:hypothetical protein